MFFLDSASWEKGGICEDINLIFATGRKPRGLFHGSGHDRASMLCPAKAVISIALQRFLAEAGGVVSPFSKGAVPWKMIMFNDEAHDKCKINLEERHVFNMAHTPPRPGSGAALSNQGLPLAGFQAGSEPNEFEAQMMPKTPWSSH